LFCEGFVTAAARGAEQLGLRRVSVTACLPSQAANRFNVMSPVSLVFALLTLMITWCSAILLVG
jgi:hypothetical protein